MDRSDPATSRKRTARHGPKLWLSRLAYPVITLLALVAAMSGNG
jgi:hypothetical protein